MMRSATNGSLLAWSLGGVAVLLLLAALGTILIATSSHSWADEHAREGRLLPGTTIAGVDVGGQPVEGARGEVEEAMQAQLERPRVVSYQGQEWTVVPREAGASPDADQAIARARDAADEFSWMRLAAARWFGAELELEAPVAVDEAEVADFVDTIAEEADRQPESAEVAWADGQIELAGDTTGWQVDRTAAVERLSEAFREGGGAVELPGEERDPEFTRDDVEPIVPQLRQRAQAALSHEVTVTARGERWSVSPRDLGAQPKLDEMVREELKVVDDEPGDVSDGTEVAAAGDAGQGAPLAIPHEELDATLAAWAEQVDDPGENASVEYTGGDINIQEGRQGEVVDREQARSELEAALRGDADRVELPFEPSDPAVTAEDFKHVLVLEQSEYTLYHYVDGNRAREWEVAVGGGGSPTPTGQFTVGQKRHMPSWHNPDPDGWGSDMPDSIDPGPNNPLGVRALNWHDNGADTLIRFHGTASTSSIGTEASQGCVRLTNDDVVELYDRVPVGTTIISMR